MVNYSLRRETYNHVINKRRKPLLHIQTITWLYVFMILTINTVVIAGSQPVTAFSLASF